MFQELGVALELPRADLAGDPFPEMNPGDVFPDIAGLLGFVGALVAVEETLPVFVELRLLVEHDIFGLEVKRLGEVGLAVVALQLVIHTAIMDLIQGHPLIQVDVFLVLLKELPVEELLAAAVLVAFLIVDVVV